MLDNAVFGADDKLFCVRLFCVFHNAGGAAGIVGKCCDFRTALGVNEEERIRVFFLHDFGFELCDPKVGGTAAADEFNVLVRAFFFDPGAEVRVGHEEDILLFHVLNDFEGGGGGDTDVGLGFGVRSRINIGDDGIARVLFFELPQIAPAVLVCHGTPGDGVCQNHGFFRREHFDGLCHEAHPAHDDGVGIGFSCFDAETVGIAHIVGAFPGVMALVGMY